MGRRLTKKYCPSLVARAISGGPSQPNNRSSSSQIPSLQKSAPKISRMRSFQSSAPTLITCCFCERSFQAISGLAKASDCTMRTACAALACGDFWNLRRAGVLKKSDLTSTVVPRLRAHSRDSAGTPALSPSAAIPRPRPTCKFPSGKPRRSQPKLLPGNPSWTNI